MTSVFLYLLRLVLCPKIWSVLKMFHVRLRRLCILLLWDGKVYKYLKSIWSNVSFKADAFLLFSFLEIKFIGVNWFIGSYESQVYISIIHDLYVALCSHYSRSNQLLSPSICPPLPFTSPTPFPLATTILLSVFISFSFMCHL